MQAQDCAVLVEPKITDWPYVKAIWEDPETMQDVGGIQELSEDRYKSWFNKVIVDGRHISKYYLIFDKERNRCLGEVSFHRYNPITKTAELNIKVKKEYRNMGVGSSAIRLILEYYFTEWKGEVMEDPVWIKNRNGIERLKRIGFKEGRRDKEEVVLRMNHEEWKIVRKA
jgi:RimJ/RimL family protein N-acetyltransferase